MHVDTDLSAYLDGELAAADRARVEAHLDGCATCHARLAELRSTASLIAALPSPRPARSLVPRVAERINRLRPLRSLSTVAAGAFLFVFLVTAVGRAGSGLGGGPEVPFGRTTAAAPAAAPAATAAIERGFATPQAVPAPAAVAPAADAARAAASATAAPAAAPFALQTTPKVAVQPSPTAARADALGSPRVDAREATRAPAPYSDPLLWLGLAVIAAIVAIGTHRRLRNN